MEKIIEKISNYHIFNYLVPGYLFLIISGNILNKCLIPNNIVYSFFIAYFVGIIISRLSSLVVEKIIINIFDLKNESYDDFVKASRVDNKIDILNQERNMYRSLCTLMIIELILKIIVAFNLLSVINNDIIIILIFLALIIIFTFSFIKQNRYITSRIKVVINRKNQ